MQRSAAGWRLSGTTVLAAPDGPTVLSYTVDCDAQWRTRTGTVRGWVGDREIVRDLFVDHRGRWYMNGVECHDVAGCSDVDYAFSPVTNLLPIRRLALAVGAEAEVRAAWLRFPLLALEPLAQRYRRIDEHRYHYSTADGAFEAELTVDHHGMVRRYGDRWVAEGEAPGEGRAP